MIWIAPSEKDTDNAAPERRLWETAEQAEPAPHFAEADFSGARPEGLLGIIFLRFAAQRARLTLETTDGRRWTQIRDRNHERCAEERFHRRVKSLVVVSPWNLRSSAFICGSTAEFRLKTEYNVPDQINHH